MVTMGILPIQGKNPHGTAGNRTRNLMFSSQKRWPLDHEAGRVSADDDEHTGRPTSCTTTETVAQIQQLIRQDRRRTIRDIAEEVGIGYGTCQLVLTKELSLHPVAASPWQRPFSHFCPHSAVSGEIQNGCHFPTIVFPWIGTLWILPISKNGIEAERTPVWFHLGDPGRIAESAWHSGSKGHPGSVPKMEDTVGPMST
jgi:hypothetical protein